MDIKPTKQSVVVPVKFFKIEFGCSNRSFYSVKSDLYSLAEKAGIEIEDGYIEERCDYEGDLDEIVVYNDKRGKLLIGSVIDFYGVDKSLVEEMNIHLSIF